MNIRPITQQQDGIDNHSLMTNLQFEFFGVQPDYQILFPFRSIGTFCLVCDGNHKGTNIVSQRLLGIALCQSEYTIGVIF